VYLGADVPTADIIEAHEALQPDAVCPDHPRQARRSALHRRTGCQPVRRHGGGDPATGVPCCRGKDYCGETGQGPRLTAVPLP
jgi:hypothetical protein